MFRLLLRITGKFLRPREVGGLIGAPRARAGDGARSDLAPGNFDQQLRRAADERRSRQSHQTHVGRRIGRAKGFVGEERFDRRHFQARGKIDLIRIAGGDVFLAARHRADEGGFVERLGNRHGGRAGR